MDEFPEKLGLNRCSVRTIIHKDVKFKFVTRVAPSELTQNAILYHE